MEYLFDEAIRLLQGAFKVIYQQHADLFLISTYMLTPAFCTIRGQTYNLPWL